MIQIQWTCPTIDEARKVIRILLENKLVACANIISNVESHYRWEGALESSNEVKVYFKTQESRFDMVEQTIRKNCSYQVPEIIAFRAHNVSEAYKRWVEEEVKIDV
ncbi:MAG: divalent-cation tolerance protein CutA [Rhabdochlamydiaceae bacterium]|nr:divalent-cation tolerance protein CutA [Rhabdochlamydiaceae bacterium]